MDRRRFIELGAAVAPAGAIGIANTSCLHSPTPSLGTGLSVPGPDLDSYLAVVDHGLDRLSTTRIVRRPGLAGGITEEEWERRNQLTRGSLRALYLTGMLGDLPLESQADERVQQRLWQIAPEFDRTVSTMTDHLSSRTSSEWADVQRLLRHRTNPAIEISAALTDEGALFGMSRGRRVQTRALFTQAGLRLRSQPPDLVVQEYLTKMEKAAESDGMDALARRRVAAAAAESAFWRDIAPKNRLGRTPTGLKTLGFGVVIFGAGALIVSAGSDVGLIVATIGAITIIVGLIQLLVYAVRNS
jgi:hypothetical protein